MSHGAAAERKHIGLLLAKEMAFREAAEEMLAVLPKIADVPSIKGPEDMKVPSGLFGWDKSVPPDFVQQWATDRSKRMIEGRVEKFIENIGYDFGHMGSSAVWKDRFLSDKFYKDFQAASFYSALDEEKIRALGYNGVAIIVQNNLQTIISGEGFPQSIRASMPDKEPHFSSKLRTMIPTYRAVMEETIGRIEEYRLKKTEALRAEALAPA